ncbi:hypothetical protein G9C98_005903 [Cotesia typhae]|uniref:Uncharacterized protein n=1 Tax=Cotesia typhae TaxID=2053667 RepID=A0A8J5QWN1_9HYME|nr:hypothetical protein G9C98_005903 [Cotesia typhae]
MPPWLRSYEMKFKSPISCGSYTLDVWLLNFWGQNVVQFFFDWTIPEGSNCLPDFQPIKD